MAVAGHDAVGDCDTRMHTSIWACTGPVFGLPTEPISALERGSTLLRCTVTVAVAVAVWLLVASPLPAACTASALRFVFATITTACACPFVARFPFTCACSSRSASRPGSVRAAVLPRTKPNPIKQKTRTPRLKHVLASFSASVVAPCSVFHRFATITSAHTICSTRHTTSSRFRAVVSDCDHCVCAAARVLGLSTLATYQSEPTMSADTYNSP